MHFVITLLALFGTASSLADFKSRCDALGRGIKVENYPSATVTIAEYLPKNTIIDQFAEGTNSTCTFPNPVVPVNLCRLALHVLTSSSSDIYMEVWLPEKWNSRLMSVGTGGLGGCIFYEDHAYVAAHGFATISSNAGHNGTSAGALYHQTEVFRDFTWRALYAATVVGKEVSKNFYGTPNKKSYFIGCSQGGRQGFKAAQFNPELFDGIIAGAPVVRLAGLFEHAARWQRMIGSGVDNMTISIDKWTAIQNETLRQCDHLDGVVDGIIEDPRRCKPDLSGLQCKKSGVSEGCLSHKELAIVTELFAPWTVNNTMIYPGMEHNGDEVAHATTLSGPAFTEWISEWARYVTRQDPSWTLDQWTPVSAALAVQQDWLGFNSWDGDLSRFRDRGGKILHYHGLSDQSVDSTFSDMYYQHVSKTMRTSSAELDEFYRYFRISGLQHCGNGPGANSIGQRGTPPPASNKPEDNVLSRIVAWVEKGEAPETVRGTKFFNDDVAQGVEFRRKHCRYPLTNVYKGKGNGTDEKGWQCVL